MTLSREDIISVTDYRSTLNGFEAKLFTLVSKRASSAQWAEWLRTPLEHAVLDGDNDLVVSLLQAGANGGAAWEGCNVRTLVHAAADGGNPDLVSTLLEAGGAKEIDASSGTERPTALHRAIAGGHSDVARVLLRAGATADLPDSRDRTTLHYAIEFGRTHLVSDLVNAGADVDFADTNSNTPLHLAAYYGNSVKELLRVGASLNEQNSDGEHPLHVAVERGHIDVAKDLLEAGADPNHFSNGFTSPLFKALGNSMMMKMLLDNGADVNAVDCEECTALHEAAYQAGSDVIDMLVMAGANLEAKTSHVCFNVTLDQATPLHLAVNDGNLSTMTALLRQGANVNAIDSDGRTPLNLLCKYVSIDTGTGSAKTKPAAYDQADLLLRWGADETIADSDGFTALDLVTRDVGSADVRRLKRMLASASADRAWRRRGVLVMCRAHSCSQSWSRDWNERGGKVRARDGDGSKCGRRDVLSRMVDVDESLFRFIVGFL